MSHRTRRTPEAGGGGERDVEHEARSLLARPSPSEVDSSIIRGLRREIGSVLGHLRDARTLHELERGRLVDLECDTATDLRQLDRRPTDYTDSRWSDRQRLKARLGGLSHERAQLSIGHRRHQQELHDRLVALINRHAQLTGE